VNAGSERNWEGELYRAQGGQLGPDTWQAEVWQSDSWQDAFVEQNTPEQGWGGSRGGGGLATDGQGRALFGGPGADLYGSGFSSHGQQAGGEGGARPGGAGSGPVSAGPVPGAQRSSPPISQSMPSISGSMPAISAQQGQQDGEDMSEPGSLVRPYARTRGRTRTDYDLAIETLVSTSERGRAQAAASTPEHRSICGLCTETRSVAEISAHLRIPLGVVRVLIGDMAGLGLVLIHDSGMVSGDRPSMEFLERVLSGLRRL
jgi:hypothetical protein